MGTKNNPGRFNCLAKMEANPDMPVFILLGSDEAAPQIVMAWAENRMNRPDPDGKAAEAINVAVAMRQWKVQHDNHIPLADATAGGWSIIPLLHGKSGAFLAGVAFTLAVFALQMVLA